MFQSLLGRYRSTPALFNILCPIVYFCRHSCCFHPLYLIFSLHASCHDDLMAKKHQSYKTQVGKYSQVRTFVSVWGKSSFNAFYRQVFMCSQPMMSLLMSMRLFSGIFVLLITLLISPCVLWQLAGAVWCGHCVLCCVFISPQTALACFLIDLTWATTLNLCLWFP